MINDSGMLRKPIAMAAVAALAAAMAVALGLSLGATQAWAIDWPARHIEDLGGKTYTISYKDRGSAVDFLNDITYLSAKSPKKKITAAKSSNPEVATVSTYNGNGYHSLSVSIQSVGTTKITYKLGGKKHTVKYKVVAYTNPLKSLKIGSKNYTKVFNPKSLANEPGSTRGSVVTSGFTGKLNAKLKSGWTLKKVLVLKKSMKLGGKIEASKNGASFNKVCCVWLIVKNKKTKAEEILYLSADSKAEHKMITQ